MSTTTRVAPGRPTALRRLWLLPLLLLGIAGMHGFAVGSGPAPGHHGAVVVATTSAGDHVHHPGHAQETAASTAAPAPSSTEEGAGTGSVIAMCLALLLAVAVMVAAGRRTPWPAEAPGTVRHRAARALPLLHVPAPVPRYTVMRC